MNQENKFSGLEARLLVDITAITVNFCGRIIYLIKMINQLYC